MTVRLFKENNNIRPGDFGRISKKNLRRPAETINVEKMDLLCPEKQSRKAGKNMSSTSGISSTSATTTSSSTVTNSSISDLANFESFIQLLCVQLQNQDPTDPVENTELVAQMAQMSTLQQLESMGQSLEAYEAYSLIDQDVTYNTTDSSGNTVAATGTVTAVTVKSGEVYLTIDDNSVSFDDLVGVNSAAT